MKNLHNEYQKRVLSKLKSIKTQSQKLSKNRNINRKKAKSYNSKFTKKNKGSFIRLPIIILIIAFLGFVAVKYSAPENSESNVQKNNVSINTQNTSNPKKFSHYIRDFLDNLQKSMRETKAIISNNLVQNSSKNVEKESSDIKLLSTMSTQGPRNKKLPYIPVMGEISSEFGEREHPITKKTEVHTGIDIAAPLGTEISASLDGTVISVGENTVYGKNVSIQHDKGIVTTYSHCSEILVKEGQSVKKSDIIALVGKTGLSTGSHLHFEVKIDDEYINPVEFLGLTN